jgi:hypothetical protein
MSTHGYEDKASGLPERADAAVSPKLDDKAAKASSTEV